MVRFSCDYKVSAVTSKGFTESDEGGSVLINIPAEVNDGLEHNFYEEASRSIISEFWHTKIEPYNNGIIEKLSLEITNLKVL